MEKAERQEWIIEMINNILIEVLFSMAEQEGLTIGKWRYLKDDEVQKLLK